MQIEVILSPSLYPLRQTRGSYAVVAVDVLRATSSLCAAFQAGAEEIVPLDSLDSLAEYYRQGYLIAAERGGEKVLVEGVAASCGNSPTEYLRMDLRGQRLAYSTTNGTRAILLASREAEQVYVGAFANLTALANRLLEDQVEHLVILCSGWEGDPCVEDTLLAGALSQKLSTLNAQLSTLNDAARYSKILYQLAAAQGLYRFCQNGTHIQRLQRKGFDHDVRFCLEEDTCPVVPATLLSASASSPSPQPPRSASSRPPLLRRLCALALVLLMPWLAVAQTDSISWGHVGTSCGLMVVGGSMHCLPVMKSLNSNIQDAVQTWRFSGPMQGARIHVDDYLQWAPLPALYLLKVCGVPARDSYLRMSALAAEAYATMGLLSLGGKYLCGVPRPNGRSNNSFPSGHSATAFCGAELLRLEYKDSAPIVGWLGYTAAIATGAMRVYNNRHWTADVLAGAGVGILSAQVANWLNERLFPPVMLLSDNRQPSSLLIE